MNFIVHVFDSTTFLLYILGMRILGVILRYNVNFFHTGGCTEEAI